jgi:biotin transporter BioY
VSLQHVFSSNCATILNATDGYVCQFWLTALIIGTFFSRKGTDGFGYYYFTEVWSALLPAGSG